MKTIVLSAIVALTLSGGFVLAAETSDVAPSTQPATHKQPAKWVCPMKCEGSESDKPGTCPKCGMELKKEKAQKGRANGKQGKKNGQGGDKHTEPAAEQNQ